MKSILGSMIPAFPAFRASHEFDSMVSLRLAFVRGCLKHRRETILTKMRVEPISTLPSNAVAASMRELRELYRLWSQQFNANSDYIRIIATAANQLRHQEELNTPLFDKLQLRLPRPPH